MTETINDVANWIALSAAIPFAGYWLTYGIGSPWYRSWLGWVMFGLGMAITLVLSFVTVRRLYGDFPGYEWWAVSVYSFLTVMGWSLWAIVVAERRRAGLMMIPLKRNGSFMSEVQITTATVPTIWYQAQRVLRTAVSTLISALTIWAALVLIWPDVMAQLATILPASWVAWLAGAVAAVTAVASALTKIMALPKVNAWLTKWLNLGSVPRDKILPPSSVVVDDPQGTPHVVNVPAVIPDPKVVQPGDTRDAYRDRNDGGGA